MGSDKMETYHGFVRTPSDAIKIFEACRLGLLPRVQRRLSEKERQSIRSGSVFVWDEREAGMRRWTDGKSWSASRVSGSFLTYREMEGKRGGGFVHSRRGAGKTPDSGRGSDEDHDDPEPEGYRYKADGLMKQSFSITTTSGQHLHLISYFSRPQPGQTELPQPSTDPSLRSIVPPKGMYPESSMGETNQGPALTRAPMQQSYMMPQHSHGHANQQPAYSHYSQSGYGWPPSPAATPPYPPYAQYQTAGSQLSPAHLTQHHHHHHQQQHHQYQQQHHQHQQQQQPPPPLPYGHGHSITAPPPPPPPSRHERHLLPPLQPSFAQLPSYQAGSSPPRLHDSPVYKERQDSFGRLPALNSVAPTAITHPGMTPPTREHSVSPQKGYHDNPTGHRSSISSLLHPPGESVAKKDASINGSSLITNGFLPEKCGSEDTRALRMLDRKFCV